MTHSNEDIYRLITECQSFNGSLPADGATQKLAVRLNICKVSYRIFFHGQAESEDSRIIYGSGDNTSGECFDFSRNSSDDKIITLKIYRNSDAPSLDEDEQYLFNIFAEAVLSGVCVRNLINAYNYVANYDAMTGLTNVNYFIRHLRKLTMTGNHINFSVAYANIKNCRLLNRLFDSRTADGLLIDFSHKADRIFNKDEGELISRLGGDNFILLYKNENEAKILDFFSGVKVSYNSYNGDIVEYTLSCRMGIVRMSDIVDDFGKAITLASNTLMSVRVLGNKDVLVYSESILSVVNNRPNYLEEINRDLNSGKFLVYYQPVVYNDGTGNMKLYGAEALVRWNRNGSIVNPLSFIPFAEKHNIINKIDLYVLEEGCRNLRSWIDEGITPVTLSFNFSKNDLVISDLVEQILSKVDYYGIDHGLINIEFTEAAFHEDYEAVCLAANKLIASGIKVSIDNFGVGFSSLMLLKNLEFNYLKIDASLVNSDSAKGKIIFENIVSLAEELGYTVVCEGIKSHEAIERVINNGCTLFQTDLYDKSLSARFFKNRLKNPEYKN